MTDDLKVSLISIIICIILMFLLAFGTNSCSHSEWNNGICSECDVKYELRGASRGLKYYACPACGNEVERY